MSILIRGMEIPTSCADCRFMEDGWCYSVGLEQREKISTVKRPTWCPLVPLPPHGRLIDADALDKAFTDLRWENGDYRNGALMHWGDRPNWFLTGNEVENLISGAPTIIPADPAEEGE